MIEQWFWHHRVCLVTTHRNMYSMTLKSQGQNLTSGQGHVVTQVGHIAYESKRLNKRNTMRQFLRLYLFWIKSYSQKTVGELVTSDDLWRVTDENCRLGHRWGPKPTPFRVNENVPMRKRGSWNFAHWLSIGRSWNWLDLRSRIKKKSEICKLLELLTSSTSKSVKTLYS